MNRLRARRLLSSKKYHDLILYSFELGKYIIIYGSILFLTFIGIIIWLLGTLNLFFLIGDVEVGWNPSHEESISSLQQLETDAITLLDLYLLSVVLFIVAMGLYGIFVKKEGGIRLPVNITEMNQLERYVFGTIVAMLLVTALNRLLYPGKFSAEENAITVGMICAVVLVISAYLVVQRLGGQQQVPASKK
ncbi:MAG: YqhA family protein [Theionarchaea archaeon]|nr:YqhA family protein [Theionarchaea archaeon]